MRFMVCELRIRSAISTSLGLAPGKGFSASGGSSGSDSCGIYGVLVRRLLSFYASLLALALALALAHSHLLLHKGTVPPSLLLLALNLPHPLQ